MYILLNKDFQKYISNKYCLKLSRIFENSWNVHNLENRFNQIYYVSSNTETFIAI